MQFYFVSLGRKLNLHDAGTSGLICVFWNAILVVFSEQVRSTLFLSAMQYWLSLSLSVVFWAGHLKMYDATKFSSLPELLKK